MKIYTKNTNEMKEKSIEEIEFRKKQKHKKLYYYTKWKYFKDSIEKRELSFGNIINQNDKDEIKLNRINGSMFLQCFSLTNEESTSMWGL